MLYRISVTERGLTGIANIFRSRLSRLDDLLGAGTVPFKHSSVVLALLHRRTPAALRGGRGAGGAPSLRYRPVGGEGRAADARGAGRADLGGSGTCPSGHGSLGIRVSLRLLEPPQ